ncbi:hypothetical protein [Streptomyces sp. WMMB 322]|uniref:hypothetical protein n=1 Tax=Streptomyces sp. WMMB 322 TaxID=1286821 RepID=UPI00131AAA4B|nr:hypothetical protein [Streptomyces sp. WMMB 322]
MRPLREPYRLRQPAIPAARAGFAPDGAQDTYDLDGQGTHIPIVRYGRPLPVTGSCSV